MGQQERFHTDISRKEANGNTAVRVNSTPPEEKPDADVIIIGGGPAGLSAALVLARANRSVLLFDSGKKRNDASHVQHAILGADGEDRAEFLQRARSQVTAYPCVSFHCCAVVDVDIEAARTEPSSNTKMKNGERVAHTWQFEVGTEDGRRWRSKKLILATGVTDLIPDVPGFQDYWGKGIWVCLYCDGYEYNDKVLGAYGNGERGVHMALEMLLWSDTVTLFTNGEQLVATDKERQLLRQKGIPVIETPIARAYGNEQESHLAGVELTDGRRIPLGALFFNTGRFQSSTLPEKMGLTSDSRGDLICEERGLYAAGNCASAPLKLVMTAASQGAITGAKINSELFYEELGLEEHPGRVKEDGCEAPAEVEAQDCQADGKRKGGNGEQVNGGKINGKYERMNKKGNMKARLEAMASEE